ncbi:arylsulfatase B-like [Anopheles cruzii]|uniref:arylsulfatase B-like n=1 Tax=Anopheles cruzii TaxID=68878 RepID=UPI0022EC39FC|nr:arylsulfatase B-like [Anopheles cruzii]
MKLGVVYQWLLSGCWWWCCGASAAQPNIVIIVADDLGWNDVSFHGSNQIPTPNLDALAYDGVILNRHYVPPLCTPARAALMTGRNPINLGMQDDVIISDQPWGLGLDERLLPQYFREAGYRTHLVGKWHLGFFRQAYTPTRRGFESHFGYLGPYIDYWDHSLQMSASSSRGRDLRRNTAVEYVANGTYATDLFNDEAIRIIRSHNTAEPLLLVLTHLAPHTGNVDDPLQAPAEEIARFGHIRDARRRTLAAMISRIDAGVGRLHSALRERNMVENSIILFLADNGAPTVGIHANSGSNYPLRGQKASPWEGAVRGVAFIWSPLLTARGYVSEQWIHVSDWLPTLGRAAGIGAIPRTDSPIDGQDQWSALQSGSGLGPRSVVMNNVEDRCNYSSYTKRGWKYVSGSCADGQYDGWLGELPDHDQLPEQQYFDLLMAPDTLGQVLRLPPPDKVRSLRATSTLQCQNAAEPDRPCEPLVAPCLFNLLEDPCERRNIAQQHPAIVDELYADVLYYRRHSVRPRNQPPDSRSDPASYNYTWTWWQDELDARMVRSPSILPMLLAAAALAIVFAVCLVVKLVSCSRNSKLEDCGGRD